MQAPDYAVLMAEYNAWMNERIYAACEEIGEAERSRPRGLFFDSIHRTLEHLVWADRLFHNRLLGTAHPVTPPEEPLTDDFAELWSLRRGLDAATLEWARGLESGSLSGPFEMRSVIYGVTKRMPRYVIAVQMFNHQTHHRGQVHAALTQLGKDVGSTDIPFMPYTEARLSETVE